MNQNRGHFLRLHHWRTFLRIIGLIAIAIFAFHAISSLVFSVVDLAPSSPKWSLTLTLAGFLALAGAAVGLQSLQVAPPRLTGLVSGAASLGILLFYSFGQLSDQNAIYAIVGAGVGLVLGGGLGYWSGGRRGFWQVAIAIASTLCAYGIAYGLGTWAFAALSTRHWPLSLLLGSLTGLYIWFTRRSLTWIYHRWANWSGERVN
ncbi:hypothetical protein [Leptothoe kymatousa]|uniref:DUF4203 domain-containing protein n=1 Tax=Leptothoe kymatousa TAU-MAC 1615 TaxID=2364775 RepID=A0ABS5Y6K5_9CYAN|nr:hypothetical protein [Leptothoe kymatousa]MBT9313460.1 hypothetical protein [Leptothoe kymatousa TAU-MAC 1615]